MQRTQYKAQPKQSSLKQCPHLIEYPVSLCSYNLCKLNPLVHDVSTLLPSKQTLLLYILSKPNSMGSKRLTVNVLVLEYSHFIATALVCGHSLCLKVHLCFPCVQYHLVIDAYGKCINVAFMYFLEWSIWGFFRVRLNSYANDMNISHVTWPWSCCGLFCCGYITIFYQFLAFMWIFIHFIRITTLSSKFLWNSIFQQIYLWA